MNYFPFLTGLYNRMLPHRIIITKVFGSCLAASMVSLNWILSRHETWKTRDNPISIRMHISRNRKFLSQVCQQNFSRFGPLLTAGFTIEKPLMHSGTIVGSVPCTLQTALQLLGFRILQHSGVRQVA